MTTSVGMRFPGRAAGTLPNCRHGFGLTVQHSCQTRSHPRGTATAAVKQSANELDRAILQGSSQEAGPARSPFHTGSSDITTAGAGRLTSQPLQAEKTILIVRHGHTTWNDESRIQGQSNKSDLTSLGKDQAARCRRATSRMHFDSCFTSPLDRAQQFATTIWEDRSSPLEPLESLAEAELGWLEGMTNEAAAGERPEEFKVWREQPADFELPDGRKPLWEVYERATAAWKEMLAKPGTAHMACTHKSMARALLCVALGLPPTAFRAVDIGNGGMTVFRVNKRGEPMLVGLNWTAHMHNDGVIY